MKVPGEELVYVVTWVMLCRNYKSEMENIKKQAMSKVYWKDYVRGILYEQTEVFQKRGTAAC